MPLERRAEGPRSKARRATDYDTTPTRFPGVPGRKALLDRELETRGLSLCRYADDGAPRAQRGPQGPRSVELLD